ncbi:hypothetical protein NC652_037017 [Populus alba x Populus x berolinensis]|nr:hypothetical protein NC652_037017 [Populus alba x Populus x berolinensis]
MTKKPQREGNRRRERVRNMQLQSLDKIVADLLKGKWDGKYIYVRARNCCNKKALAIHLARLMAVVDCYHKKGLRTSDPSCEIDGSGGISSYFYDSKGSKGNWSLPFAPHFSSNS